MVDDMIAVCWYLTGENVGELVDAVRSVRPDATIVVRGDGMFVPLGRYDYDAEPEDSPRSVMETELRCDPRLTCLYLRAYRDVTTQEVGL